MNFMRQGDVLLIPAKLIEATVVLPHQRQADLTLAEGEVTGHRHRVAEGKAELYRTDKAMILKVHSETALLVHEEHQPLQIPRGNWVVKIQRGYHSDHFYCASEPNTLDTFLSHLHPSISKPSIALFLSILSLSTLQVISVVPKSSASPIVNAQNNTMENVKKMRLDQDLKSWQIHLDKAKASGNRDHEASALTNIGAIYDSSNLYDKALNHYQQGLLIFRALRDRKKEAWVLNNIGATYNNLKQYDKAVESYLKAVAVCRAEGTLVSEGWILASLGNTYRLMKQYNKAIDAFQEAIKSFQTTNSQTELAETIKVLREVQQEISGIGISTVRTVITTVVTAQTQDLDLYF
jgi:tetratricopeptide (TPR) repeat protein